MQVHNNLKSDKLSTIGDFGYVYEGFYNEEFRKSYGVGRELLSSGDVKVKEDILSTFQLKDSKMIEKLLMEEEKQLKEEVIKNRKTNVDILNVC